MARRPMRTGVLLMLLSLIALLAALAGIPPGGTGRPAFAASDPPPLTARSSALVEVTSGRVLYSEDGHVRRPMASTTKMMTALLTVELADPEATATVSSRHLVGGSSAYLRAGERISVRNLLYALMLPSGNDAAMVLAEYVGQTHLGGSGTKATKRFVQAMNERATELQMRNTHFVNPHGLDAPDHHSSALDLARLGRAVLANPLLSGVVSTGTYRATGYLNGAPVYHTLLNTNRMLCKYPGILGVKTGLTPNAGQMLVAASRRGDHALIGVVMSSENRDADTGALLSWGFGQVGGVRVATKVCQESSAEVMYSGAWTRYYHSSHSGGYVRHTSDTGAVSRLRFTGRGVRWIAPRNTNRGKARVYIDGQPAATVDLYAGSFKPRQTVFSWDGLSTAPHTIEVRVLGARNAASSGNRVDIDAFVILR